MSSFTTRAISGVVYVLLFVGAVLYSKHTFLALTTILGLISVYEFTKMIALKTIVPYLFVLFFSYIAFTDYYTDSVWIVLALTLICSVQLLFALFTHKTIGDLRFQKLDFSIRYVAFSFLFLLFLPFISGIYTPKIIIGILVIIWVNDSFAYLIGKNFGKHKLFEKISPRKTIEGFIGGVIFSLLAGVILSKYYQGFSLLNWIVIALLVSILGTLGDLVESKFKRQAKVKDSGTIMPGHGGILDRLDSLLFAAPFVYLYIHYLI